MPTASPGPLEIEQAALRTGAWAWAETRLYEVLGAWARTASSAPCKLYFDSCSQHHAWRAQLWRDRLPGRLVQAYPGLSLPQPPPGLVGPPSRAAEAAMAVLSDLQGDAGRLAAHCRVVLARSAAAYQGWLQDCGPSADRPTARALSMALSDVVADWREGSALLVGLVTDGGEGAVAEAAASTALVERALLLRDQTARPFR